MRFVSSIIHNGKSEHQNNPNLSPPTPNKILHLKRGRGGYIETSYSGGSDKTSYL